MRRWDRLLDSYIEEYLARGVSPQSVAYTVARPMRRSYPAGDFVFQNGAQDLQPGLPGQLFHLRLHLRPHLGYRQRHLHQQLLPSDDFELVIGLTVIALVFLFRGGSLL